MGAEVQQHRKSTSCPSLFYPYSLCSISSIAYMLAKLYIVKLWAANGNNLFKHKDRSLELYLTNSVDFYFFLFSFFSKRQQFKISSRRKWGKQTWVHTGLFSRKLYTSELSLIIASSKDYSEKKSPTGLCIEICSSIFQLYNWVNSKRSHHSAVTLESGAHFSTNDYDWACRKEIAGYNYFVPFDFAFFSSSSGLSFFSFLLVLGIMSSKGLNKTCKKNISAHLEEFSLWIFQNQTSKPENQSEEFQSGILNIQNC